MIVNGSTTILLESNTFLKKESTVYSHRQRIFIGGVTKLIKLLSTIEAGINKKHETDKNK